MDTSTGTAEPKSAQTLYNQGYGLRKILTDVANENKISIPLNIYSYFAAFKNNLHPNIKMSSLIRLANDNDIIFRNAGAPDSKVLITKFRLWCPKLILNGAGMKQYVENYLKPKTWKYLREHQEIHQTAAVSSFFRISIGIQRPRHVFLWVNPTASYNSQEHNIFTFKTFSIVANTRYFSKAQQQVNNSICYPQLELSANEESRLYRTLMSVNSGYNDFPSGSLLDRSNFRNLFGIIYFDLRNQEEDTKNSVVSLTFRYELNGANNANYYITESVFSMRLVNLRSVTCYKDQNFKENAHFFFEL